MTVLEDVVELLTGQGLKVYPLSVPAKDAIYPNVAYQMISNREFRSHAGAEAQRPRVQLACHGKTYASCRATAETVKAAMDLNRTDFMLATRENEFHAKEVEPEIYRIVLDYFVWQGV